MPQLIGCMHNVSHIDNKVTTHVQAVVEQRRRVRGLSVHLLRSVAC